MHKVFKNIVRIFVTMLLLQSTHAGAQKKYALILGVNDYYDQPGVLNYYRLHGCVNDAKSMQRLLLNRFGYEAANITLLTDSLVTRRRVLDATQAILKLCKPGDAFVFYFSGHGVYINNYELDNDPVKQGLGGAMVLSDLYAPGWDCLLRDETIKAVFNQFVHKKVVVTSFFDCCFSGNITMDIYEEFWAPNIPSTTDRFLEIESLPYQSRGVPPSGCDALHPDSVDSDRDGVPDCRDWEVHSIEGWQVNDSGVLAGRPDPPSFATSLDPYIDSVRRATDTSYAKSYNLRSALRLNERPAEPRPSDTPGSLFAALSAATDRQKGQELTNESGMRHGAFTQAMLAIYRDAPATLPLRELMSRIKNDMAAQGFDQVPTYHYDDARAGGNLLGISSSGFGPGVRATCVARKGHKAFFNKGLLDGVTVGNKLSLGRSSVVISAAGPDTAAAVDAAGLVKVGDQLLLTDPHIVSTPLIKLYIPRVATSTVAYGAFLKSVVPPRIARAQYRDPSNRGKTGASTEYIFYDNMIKPRIAFKNQGAGRSFVDEYLFLPPPSYLADSVRAILRLNQSFELVDNPAQANLVLYLTYQKGDVGYPPGYLFYFHPSLNEMSFTGASIFAVDRLLITSLEGDAKTQKQAVNEIVELANRTLISAGNVWKNKYPRR
jgi:hypothetical protein